MRGLFSHNELDIAQERYALALGSAATGLDKNIHTYVANKSFRIAYSSSVLPSYIYIRGLGFEAR
jgi:hypothetical protein